MIRITLWGANTSGTVAMQESIRELPETRKKHDWTRRKGSYGIDAPYLLPILGVLFVGNIINGVVTGSVWPSWARPPYAPARAAACTHRAGARSWYGRSCWID